MFISPAYHHWALSSAWVLFPFEPHVAEFPMAWWQGVRASLRQHRPLGRGISTSTRLTHATGKQVVIIASSCLPTRWRTLPFAPAGALRPSVFFSFFKFMYSSSGLIWIVRTYKRDISFHPPLSVFAHRKFPYEWCLRSDQVLLIASHHKSCFSRWVIRAFT